MNFKTIIMMVMIVSGIIGGSIFLRTDGNACTTETFVVGTAAGYAPFVSINPQGDYEGFDIEVANALAKQMGKKLILKDLGSMGSLFTALDQGSIDAIIWGLSITQERVQKITMIHYQGETTASYPLLFWKTIPAEVRTISDMSGKVVCVEPNSSQDAVLSKYALINKLPTEKVDDALLNIQYGKSGAAFVEPAIAKKFRNKYPEIQILDVPLAPEDQVQGVGIVVKQTNSKVIKHVQEAVDVLKSTGIIKELEQKWGVE